MVLLYCLAKSTQIVTLDLYVSLIMDYTDCFPKAIY